MALFGLPGGAEWLVIGGTVLLLFFPGTLLVWVGFVLGRRSTAGAGSPARSGPAPGPAAGDQVAETEDVD
jgi:hypothetical protein